MAVIVSIAHRSRPYAGETVNGDAVWVRRSGGVVCFGVIDASGHGPEAARVAADALEALNGQPASARVERLLRVVDDRLRGSRGAAATVCVVEDGVLRGAGVGNVELRAVGRSVPALITAGILGRPTYRLRTFEFAVAPGDRLLLWSDGISARVVGEMPSGLPLDDACAWLLRAGGRATDDATALVADIGLEEAS